ncbi:MAG: transglycosylase family protein [Solirubrobacterales bacterium]
MAPRLRIAIAAAVTAIAVVLYASLAGAADPDLEQRIDSASSEAELIAQRITTQSSRISELRARASDAAARETELRTELRENTIRRRELSDDLVVAERELEAVRARYDRALAILSGRLVAIYKGDEPDELTVILDADGYDDLTTRADYLEALTDADESLADRVRALHDQVEASYERIAEIKAELDRRAQELESARAEMERVRAEAASSAGEIADAKAEAAAALAELREKISGWELEARRQAAEELAGADEAFLGGPYAIPTYIVICESGGNYRALNPSSMAGGAYQIIPSTWKAYGGEGPYAHLASKAEQDRIAAIIWREDGPGAWSCA